MTQFFPLNVDINTYMYKGDKDICIYIYMQYNIIYTIYIHWETHLFSLHRSVDVGVRSMWEDLP